MIGMIVAYGEDRVIGKNGRIPWYIKGELSRFRALTTGHSVIMGRRSFEELTGPLPDRRNIVLSRTKDFTGENVVTVRSLDEALRLAADDDEIYIAGGAEIFRQAIDLADVLYVTEVEIAVEGGTAFFPAFDESLYDKEIVRRVEGDIPYTYVTYTRKK